VYELTLLTPVIHILNVSGLFIWVEALVAGDNETIRSAGMIIILFISYSNTGTFDLKHYEYSYKLDYIEVRQVAEFEEKRMGELK